MQQNEQRGKTRSGPGPGLCGAAYVALFLATQYAATGLLMLAFLLGGSSVEAAMRRADSLASERALITAILTLALLAALAAARQQNPVRAAQLVPMRGLLIPMCLVLGLGLNLAVSGVLNTVSLPDFLMEGYAERVVAFDDDNVPMYILAVVLAAPLTEEVVFRRGAYGNFKKIMPPMAAALVSSLIFALMHGALLWMTYTVPLGLVMCLVYERCGSLWGSVLLHIGFNAGSLIVVNLPYYTWDWSLYTMIAVGAVLSACSLILLIRYTKGHGAAAPGGQGQMPEMEI